MGHIVRTAGGSALAAFGITAVALGCIFAGTDAAAAVKAKPGAPAAPVSEAEQQQKSAAQTRQAYEAGLKSYSAAKYQPAIDELSTALRAGGLASSEMAKALYVRGMAYKKLSKPGLAISDLTSALWLKNGLGEADQKTAIAERAEAYRIAGLGDGNSGNDKVSVADPNPSPAGAKASIPVIAAAAPPPAKAAPAPSAAAAPAVITVATPSGEITRQSPDSEAARDAANARKLASAPVETSSLQAAAAGALIGDQSSHTPSPILASTASPAPNPPASSVPSSATAGASSGNSVTGFFSNMFGGSSKPAAPAADAAPVVTASTTSPATASSWSDTTSVASGAANKKASAKAGQQPAAPPATQVAAATPSGKYKIHIAAVRSRAEAEALAKKLAAQNGAALKSRTPVVDEAVIGSMGTFYRVRVGSYANAEEPRGVCNTLRASGFDCLVVTN